MAERRGGRARSGSGRSRERSRSRDRSRARRRVRSRSRSGLSRSVSRELLRGEEPVIEIARLVRTQQEVLLDLLKDHKEEVDTKLQARTRKFASRQIEKQYELNTAFLDLAQKAQAAVEIRDGERAKLHLGELIKQLGEHEEDLLIADASPHGWLAVSKIRSTKELPKDLRKRLAAVDKQLSSQKEKPMDGGFKRKFPQFSGAGQQNPVFRRQERRVSPEEAMFAAARQIRPGTCSHCHKELHYYRECPEFWAKVHASREAKAKEPQPAAAAN